MGDIGSLHTDIKSLAWHKDHYWDTTTGGLWTAKPLCVYCQKPPSAHFGLGQYCLVNQAEEVEGGPTHMDIYTPATPPAQPVLPDWMAAYVWKEETWWCKHAKGMVEVYPLVLLDVPCAHCGKRFGKHKAGAQQHACPDPIGWGYLEGLSFTPVVVPPPAPAPVAPPAPPSLIPITVRIEKVTQLEVQLQVPPGTHIDSVWDLPKNWEELPTTVLDETNELLWQEDGLVAFSTKTGTWDDPALSDPIRCVSCGDIHYCVAAGTKQCASCLGIMEGL